MRRLGGWEVLSQLAVRMPRLVREHEILRLAAVIGWPDAPEGARRARHEVLKWAEKRSGSRLSPEAWDSQNFDFYSGGRNSSGVRIQSSDADIWAIRADDPDKNIAGRVWTTEVVVGLIDDQPARFSARLLVGTQEDDLSIEPHSPGLVQQVAESCGLLRGGYAVAPEPQLISSNDQAADLVRMLTDANRKLPVFVLTVPEVSPNPNLPLLDASALARAVLGLAHVIILPARYTWVLTRNFGKQRAVFGGAVRSYLPGFSDTANPYRHRLLIADDISVAGGVEQSVRWLRTLAAAESVRQTELGRDVLSFASIRNTHFQLKQQQLISEGASDREQLIAANARIEALIKQMEGQKDELNYFDSEHRRAEERAETAEEQLRASAFRIQTLTNEFKKQGTSEPTFRLPHSWSEFSSWCDVNLAGRVVLTPAARKSVRAPEFEDFQVAAQCLQWLAAEGRDRRINGGTGSLRDEAVTDGIRNAHCGTDQFDLYWQGQQRTADWHIKNGGNTRDPKRCLRIYYFWDDSTQQIVVADMPAHRRTDAT